MDELNPVRHTPDGGHPREAKDGRQPYVRPAVRVEGSIEELTRAVGTRNSDGLFGSSV